MTKTVDNRSVWSASPGAPWPHLPAVLDVAIGDLNGDSRNDIAAALSEPRLRELVASTGFALHNLSYRLHGDVGQFEYRMVLRTMDVGNATALSEKLKSDPNVLEFRLAPTGD